MCIRDRDNCFFAPATFTGGLEYQNNSLHDIMTGYHRDMEQDVRIASAFVPVSYTHLESVGELGEVYQSVFIDAYVDKCAAVGDVSYDAGQFHAFAQVIDGAHVLVKFKYLYRSAWVTSGLVQLLQDVFQCRHAQMCIRDRLYIVKVCISWTVR